MCDEIIFVMQDTTTIILEKERKKEEVRMEGREKHMTK